MGNQHGALRRVNSGLGFIRWPANTRMNECLWMLMLPVECVKQQMSVALLTLRLYVNVVFATRCASSKWPKKKKSIMTVLICLFSNSRCFQLQFFWPLQVVSTVWLNSILSTLNSFSSSWHRVHPKMILKRSLELLSRQSERFTSWDDFWKVFRATRVSL